MLAGDHHTTTVHSEDPFCKVELVAEKDHIDTTTTSIGVEYASGSSGTPYGSAM